MNEATAQEAISQLFERHANMIYNLGYRMCGSREGAQDLVQETFLRAFKHWQKFEGRSNAATWLYTIAVRACQRLKRPRAGQPKQMLALEELLPGPQEDVVVLAEEAANPLDEALRNEALARIEHGLAQLPMEYRLALLLKEVADFSVAEVAQILGIKEATVKTRVHRARLLLRKFAVENFPRRKAPNHEHAQRACLDLLHAKQQALDRGAAFPLPESELCSRCRSLFATLDLTHEACLRLRNAELPEAVRELLRKNYKKSSPAKV